MSGKIDDDDVNSVASFGSGAVSLFLCDILIVCGVDSFTMHNFHCGLYLEC